MVVRPQRDWVFFIVAGVVLRDGGSTVKLLFLRGGSDEVFCAARPVRSVCRRTEVIDSARRRLEEVILLPLRLQFLLSVVGDGGEAGWILFLKDASGKIFVCSMSSVRLLWGHQPACGWVSCSGISSSRALLLCFLCLLVLCSGASGYGWLSSMAEDGGCGDKSLGPTADVLFSSTSCGLPKLGVRPSICTGEMGGSMFLDAGERALKRCSDSSS